MATILMIFIRLDLPLDIAFLHKRIRETLRYHAFPLDLISFGGTAFPTNIFRGRAFRRVPPSASPLLITLLTS